MLQKNYDDSESDFPVFVLKPEDIEVDFMTDRQKSILFFLFFINELDKFLNQTPKIYTPDEIIIFFNNYFYYLILEN